MFEGASLWTCSPGEVEKRAAERPFARGVRRSIPEEEWNFSQGGSTGKCHQTGALQKRLSGLPFADPRDLQGLEEPGDQNWRTWHVLCIVGKHAITDG